MVAQFGGIDRVLVAADGKVVGLPGAQPQRREVRIGPQAAAVPDEAVDAVAQQRHLAQHIGIEPGRALGPADVDERQRRKIRMQRNTEQATFRGGIDGKIEHGRRLHHAPGGPFHLAGRFFQDQGVVGADKGDPDRRGQATEVSGDLQVRVEHFNWNRISERSGRSHSQQHGDGESRRRPRGPRPCLCWYWPPAGYFFNACCCHDDPPIAQKAARRQVIRRTGNRYRQADRIGPRIVSRVRGPGGLRPRAAPAGGRRPRRRARCARPRPRPRPP